MPDIVKRLREYNSIPAVGSKLRIGKAIADAAVEIERLREALSAMTELFKATEASAQFALSEVERLRAALKEGKDA